MKKITEKKKKSLEELISLSENFSSLILIDYSKVKSTDMKYIRKSFFDNNINIKVFKNTLAKKIFLEKENKEICEFLKGQILLIFSKNDPILPIKIVDNFSRENDEIKIKLIYLYGNIFFEKNVNELINLPDTKKSLFNLQMFLKTPLLRFNNNLKYMLKRFSLLLSSLEKIKSGEKNEQS